VIIEFGMVTGVDLYSHATSWLRLVMKSVGSLPLSCDVPLRSGTVHVHTHDRRSITRVVTSV